MKHSEKNQAFKVAFCGVMAALGTTLLSITGIIPIMTYAAPIYVSALLIAVMTEVGTGGAWATWFVTSVLTLLLSPDKEAAAFYIFIGYYPMVKKHFDSIKSKALRFIVKLLFFIASLAAMYVVLIYAVGMESVIQDFKETALWANAAMFAVMVCILMVYDNLIEKLSVIYMKKLRPKLGKIIRR